MEELLQLVCIDEDHRVKSNQLIITLKNTVCRLPIIYACHRIIYFSWVESIDTRRLWLVSLWRMMKNWLYLNLLWVGSDIWLDNEKDNSYNTLIPFSPLQSGLFAISSDTSLIAQQLTHIELVGHYREVISQTNYESRWVENERNLNGRWFPFQERLSMMALDDMIQCISQSDHDSFLSSPSHPSVHSCIHWFNRLSSLVATEVRKIFRRTSLWSSLDSSSFSKEITSINNR